MRAIYLLREDRATQLMSGEALRSGPIGAIGFALYPAVIVGLCACVRWWERCSPMVKALAGVSALSIAAAMVLSGGRGSAVALALVLLGALVLRSLAGLPLLPASRALLAFAGAAVLAFAAYGSFIWSVRASQSSMDAGEFLVFAERSWGMRVDPGFSARLEPLIGIEGIRILAASLFYFTQSTSVMERVIGAEELRPMWGVYQVDALAGLWRLAFGGEPGLLSHMNAVLFHRGIYGFFAGAWGALIVDFGRAGAFVATATWGWAAGASWNIARRRPCDPGSLIGAFWLAASAWSFISSPIGFSNAAVLLGWFLSFAWLARAIDARMCRTHMPEPESIPPARPS
jgi:hypothetical protein